MEAAFSFGHDLCSGSRDALGVKKRVVMDTELWKIAIVNLGMGGALAAVLLMVVRQLLQRDEMLIGQLVHVVEVNSKALSDVRHALEEIRRFMEKVDQRLARVEEKVARIEGRLETKGEAQPDSTF